MFPNLAAQETCVAETNFAAKKHFCVRNIFPSLATPGNITRNIVSATMFPSLARALDKNQPKETDKMCRQRDLVSFALFTIVCKVV